MADGVPYTSDPSVIVATDYCGSAGHVELIKLAVSSNGDATPLPADPTYGLAVDVKRLTGSLSLSGSVTITGLSTVSLIGTGVIYTIPFSSATQQVSGNVNVFQGTNPWVTSRVGTGATIIYPAATLPVTGNVNVVSQKGADNIVYGQATITSGGLQIAGSRPTRRSIAIVNHGTIDVFLGNAGVLTTTGLKLKGIDGNSVVLATTAAVTGIVAATSQAVSYVEIYD